MTGDISGTKMLNNGLGGVFAVNSNATLTNVSVTDSVISGGSTGVRSNSLAAASFARIFVTRCTIQNTQFALGSETNNLGSSEVAVGASMIANNIMGVFQNGTGSAVRSSGNNQFYENPNQVGILTSVGLQ
jgi:hypothetical protein